MPPYVFDDRMTITCKPVFNALRSSGRCSFCKTINLEQLLSGFPNGAAPMTPTLHKRADCGCSCPLCTLMRDITPKDRACPGLAVGDSIQFFFQPDSSGHWEAFNGPRWFCSDMATWMKCNNNSLANFRPFGCIGVSRPLHSGEEGVEIRVIPPRIKSFAIIRDWLNHCTKYHDACSNDVGVSVPHLRLVDCKTRKVVLAALDVPYAALSYVWGTCHSSPVGKSMQELPRYLPQTIADAIEVTLALNLRYLWIDRYCIPQDDDEAKSVQISFMHRIYQRSQITIIDAVGCSPEYGCRESVLREKYGSESSNMAQILFCT